MDNNVRFNQILNEPPCDTERFLFLGGVLMTLVILWDLKRQKLLNCDNLWKLRGAGGSSVGFPWDENYLLITNRLPRVWKPPTLTITNRYRNFVNYFLKIIIISLHHEVYTKIIRHPRGGKLPRIILILAPHSWFSESVMASVCCAPFGCSNAGGRGGGHNCGPAAAWLICCRRPTPGPVPPPPHPSSRRGIAAPLAQAGAALMNVYVFPDQRNGQYIL